MERQNETVELFEAFTVEEFASQVRKGDYYNYCGWC